MLLSFADRLQRFRLPVSLLQALSVLIIGIMVLTFCIPVQTVEADGWDKIKVGLGLLGTGAGVVGFILAAPVTVPVTVAFVAAAAGGALIGGGLMTTIMGAVEERTSS